MSWLLVVLAGLAGELGAIIALGRAVTGPWETSARATDAPLLVRTSSPSGVERERLVLEHVFR